MYPFTQRKITNVFDLNLCITLIFHPTIMNLHHPVAEKQFFIITGSSRASSLKAGKPQPTLWRSKWRRSYLRPLYTICMDNAYKVNSEAWTDLYFPVWSELHKQTVLVVHWFEEHSLWRLQTSGGQGPDMGASLECS